MWNLIKDVPMPTDRPVLVYCKAMETDLYDIAHYVYDKKYYEEGFYAVFKGDKYQLQDDGLYWFCSYDSGHYYVKLGAEQWADFVAANTNLAKNSS